MLSRFRLVAMLGLLAACGAPSAPASDTSEDDLSKSCTATSPRTRAIHISVLPEAGEKPYVDSLMAAHTSIRLMVYMLGEDGIFNALTTKAKAGVDVRVILDGNAKRSFNQPAFDALTAAGVKVQWSDPKFPFMHAKTFVVDTHEAMISTGNYPADMLSYERNYVAQDDDLADVKVLAALFDADWNKQDPSITCTRLLISPINSKQRVLDLIASAESSLRVETLELADPEVVAAILARKADKTHTVDVRVVMADPTWNSSNQNAKTAATLAKAEIPVRYIPKARMLVHVKSILVDEQRAYMGSENLTATSLEQNREIGLVVTNSTALRTMSSTFEDDFASAQEFPAAK